MVVSPFPHIDVRDVQAIDLVHRPEIWGGVEPTVNRVGDVYHDQLVRSGHEARIDDLDLFADLGIKAIRYPVLWEKIAPGHLDNADWAWPDARLARLRQLGVRPIVGLVHHGSGPLHTSLMDLDFPEKLAAYAGAVARRYPWIQDYTPVNEPLTTARFSGLYGHWYPHERTDRSFARALIGQCRAIVLAMQAIREINPSARLVQTEELGMVHSTPELAYQADYENERRWLTFDLLSGQLAPDRRMWTWLQESGIGRQELEWFLDNRCPPDLLGINYYLSSERFLDHKVDQHPGECIGTNGIDSYIDVSAARALPQPIRGVEALLLETWQRYRVPIAITEVHNGGAIEEQLRWLHEVWHHAVRACRSGVDVRAVTVWALLGSYDWASLVTEDSGVYEPGVFDITGPEPRATALARMTYDLAADGEHDHPVLDIPGWWRRPDRLASYSPTALVPGHGQDRNLEEVRTGSRNILIIAVDDDLTTAITAACAARHIPATVLEGSSINAVAARLAQGDIWAMVLSSLDGFLTEQAVSVDALTDLACRGSISVMTFTSVPSTGTADAAATGHTQELVIIANGTALADSASGSNLENLVHIALDLLIDHEQGQWCVAQSEARSWHALRVGVEAAPPHPDVAGELELVMIGER